MPSHIYKQATYFLLLRKDTGLQMSKEEKGIIDFYCTYLSTCYFYCPRLVAGNVNVFLLHTKTEFILYRISDHMPVTGECYVVLYLYTCCGSLKSHQYIQINSKWETKKELLLPHGIHPARKCIRGALAWLISCY